MDEFSRKRSLSEKFANKGYVCIPSCTESYIQIPPPESKQPEGGDERGDALKGDAGETKAGAISGGIIGVLVLLVAVIFFLKYKKKKGGSSKKAADYTYSPAGGGDELDNLIPNKQSFVFRNHFNHTRFIFVILSTTRWRYTVP